MKTNAEAVTKSKLFVRRNRFNKEFIDRKKTDRQTDSRQTYFHIKCEPLNRRERAANCAIVGGFSSSPNYIYVFSHFPGDFPSSPLLLANQLYFFLSTINGLFGLLEVCEIQIEREKLLETRIQKERVCYFVSLIVRLFHCLAIIIFPSLPLLTKIFACSLNWVCSRLTLK